MTSSSPPKERLATLRKEMLDLLARRPVTARDISTAVGIPEKAVYDHLDHLRRSLQRDGGRLVVTPARCLSCDFTFSKRDRLTPPGRCPVCRKTHLEDPMFQVM